MCRLRESDSADRGESDAARNIGFESAAVVVRRFLLTWSGLQRGCSRQLGWRDRLEAHAHETFG